MLANGWGDSQVSTLSGTAVHSTRRCYTQIGEADSPHSLLLATREKLNALWSRRKPERPC
ncbi:hypothetical protein MPTK1_8g01505 [Marchantia polymorpha subsp. ruderalis]